MPGTFPAIGNYWVVLAAALLGVSHMSAILAMAGELYGVREGYRLPRLTDRAAGLISLETMLIGGAASIVSGLVVLGAVMWSWTVRDFAGTHSVLPAVIGTLLLTLGFQNALGGFLLAIIGGNEARFLAPQPHRPQGSACETFPFAI